MNKTIKHLVVIGQQFQVNHILSKSVAVSYATRASLGLAPMPHVSLICKDRTHILLNKKYRGVLFAFSVINT